MKFGQVTEYKKLNISDLFFFFKKKEALYEVKESGLQLSFNMF